jgi:hypothetical protein
VILLARRILEHVVTAHARGAHPARIVAWWEFRRLPYNMIVGMTGMLSAGIMITTAVMCVHHGGAPIGLPHGPIVALLGVVLFAVVANVCYTGGWITELLVAKVWHAESPRFGPIAFTLGTAFAVLATLAPAAVVVVSAAHTACRGL